jgi:MFS family permease
VRRLLPDDRQRARRRLVLSLLIVYLHDVRGMSTAVAGLVLSWMAVLSLLVAPLAGMVIDRIGPLRVLMGAQVVEAVGVFLYGQVVDTKGAFLAATLAGIGGAGLWPSQTSLVAALAPPEDRQQVFGLQFMLLNLGLGLGGLLGAVVIDTSRPGTFVVLYTAAAASYLGYLVAVATLRGYGGPVPPEAPSPGPSRLRRLECPPRGPGLPRGARRPARRLIVASLVMTTCGYGSLEAGVPAFTTQVAGCPRR